ncbi:MAG: Uma2 family endonuclease [Planctomycetota bacterium]
MTLSPPTTASSQVPVGGGSVLDTERGSLVVPADADTLAGFRRWTASDDFPEWGRIDYLDGTLYFDLMAERIYSHSLPKHEIMRVVGNRAKELGFGRLGTDSTRIVLTAPQAISCEPDGVGVSFESLKAGRVTMVPTADKGDMIEFQGPPDWVLELLSPSSENKDAVRLPEAFFAGGVREYWLADCRGEEARLTIHTRGPDRFEPVERDDDGFQPSQVFERSYRLRRSTDPLGDPAFTLDER